MNNITIVTGLWDLGRGDLEGWAKRDFQYYKTKFFELLETDVQMCIWIPKELEQEVIDARQGKPTQIYIKELEDFKTWFPFFDKLQEIRTNPEWYNIAGWLSESPQALLEYYNPMMMCKMFMVNDSAVFNPFNTEYFFWLDGGITTTVFKEYFQHEKVLNYLENYMDSHGKFTFIAYPYRTNHEIHGFERGKMAEYCGVDFVDKISRGGFWGGTKDQVHQVNGLYYEILEKTINDGYMGADECLFTILTYKYPELIQYHEIEENGLIVNFFKHIKTLDLRPLNANKNNVALYVLTYNSPNQFRTLIESFKLYDINFLDKPKKFLLNNSTNHDFDKEYDELCKEYGFEEIKQDNIGICGGRQFIAEHSEENGFDYHMFFEDDMFFYVGEDESCRNGFKRKINNLYSNVVKIAQNENFDFLKFNFTEFYGNNSKQWAWFNVPPNVREELFPENPTRTSNSTDEAPFLNFKNIKSLNGVPYATGEIYYCNWPQIVSRKGSQKMFLDVKWAHPFEQTWMSHMYQKTLQQRIKPGILLATPTEHNRFEFYPKEDRREN